MKTDGEELEPCIQAFGLWYVLYKVRRIEIQDKIRNGIKHPKSRKIGIQDKKYVNSINCSACDEKFNAANLYIMHYQAKHEG